MCVEYDLLYHGTEIQVNRKTEFYIFFYIIAADFADDPVIFNRAGCTTVRAVNVAGNFACVRFYFSVSCATIKV